MPFSWLPIETMCFDGNPYGQSDRKIPVSFTASLLVGMEWTNMWPVICYTLARSNLPQKYKYKYVACQVKVCYMLHPGQV